MRAAIFLLLVLLATTAVHADDLTKMIQEDLVTLGYEPGDVTGEATIPTVVAISKFQAEHDLEVTGEPTPQLAGIIKAQISMSSGDQTKVAPAAAAVPASTAAAAQTPEMLQAAQQQCLMDKQAKAVASQKKKRGLGSLLSAISRTASQTGNIQTATDIANTSNDIYDVNATASDLESAAQDLGLTEDQVEACRSPS